MDKRLLEYLRAMALEMAAMAEEGNFDLLSRLFGMAALEAAQRLGPAIAFSQEVPREPVQEAIQDVIQAALQGTAKASPQEGRLSAPQRQPRSRRRRDTGELAGMRGFRRSRKHPLHAAT
jgi:hypothetical protein